MIRYRWARGFIRQTRWLSVLLILLGLAFVGFQAWRLKNHVQEIAYRPSAELAQALADVRDTLQDCINIINTFQDGTGGKHLPESLANPPDLLPEYNSLASLKEADDEIGQADVEAGLLKQFLVASVQQNISDLVTQLRAHAAALGANSTVTTPAPSPAPTMRPGLRGLFAEDITSDLAEQRKEQLKQVEDLMGVLLQRTEKPENQAKIQSSIDELHRLEGLLAYLTVPAEIISATANLQPNPTPGAPQPPRSACFEDRRPA